MKVLGKKMIKELRYIIFIINLKDVDIYKYMEILNEGIRMVLKRK